MPPTLTERSQRFRDFFMTPKPEEKPPVKEETPATTTTPATTDEKATTAPEVKADAGDNGKNGVDKHEPEKTEEKTETLAAGLSDLVTLTKERLAAKKAAADKAAEEAKNMPPVKEEAKPKPEEVKVETKPAEEVKAEPEKVQVKKRKAEPLPTPSVDPIKAEVSTTLPTVEVPKTLEDRAGFRLDEDQRDYLEHVEYAEKIDPAKKGLLDRELGRLKKFEERIREWEKDHPGEEFNLNFDEETKRKFEKLQRENPPALTRKDMRAVEQRRIRDDVTREIEAKQAERFEPITRELTEVRRGPKIAAQVAEVEKSLLTDLPEDFKGAKVVADLAEIDPVIGERVQALISNAAIAVNEYLHVAAELKKPDLQGNAHHRWLANTIYEAGEWMKANGGNGRIQDGKQFATPSEFARMVQVNPEQAQSKYWTFNEEQAVGILRQEAARLIKDEIETGRAKLQKGGYVRAPKTEQAKATPEKDGEKAKTTSPRVSTSPNGGGSSTATRKADIFERHLMTSTRAK